MGKNFIAEGAKVLGDVRLGDGASVWYNAVIRADENIIEIGEGSNVQDCAVLHSDHGHNFKIGRYVTIGHGAIVHGADVGDNTIIGMGATILQGAKIGANCIIGAGALVTERAEIPDGSLVVGIPGKIRRELTPEEIEGNRKNAQEYIDEAKELMK